MKRLTFLAAMILMLALADVAYSQTAGDTLDPTNINDTWVTMTGNIVDVTVSGTDVTLYFPSFARTMRATYDNGILIYITYYRDPFAEECYINVPEEDYEFCRRLIQPGTPRHRFTLTLSEDGMVLSGTKEINVLQVQWDTDENGDRINHRPAGYRYQYFSDYQWRSANCDFEGLPTLTGTVIERYELIGIIFDFYGLRAEHYLQDFNHRSRIRFVYEQAYLDSNTGVFVPPQAAMLHTHTEPLNGRVVMDEESGEYIIELYP
ncbi:MAG TPA: hypothetical protein ENN67_06085, partial [Firmicutes bacterium]|nr:hypothetical protein [Bacillota bacterium]